MSETKKCDSGLCRRAITAQGDEALQAVVNLDEAFAAERAANEATKRELAEVVRAVSQHLSTGVKGGDSDPTWNIKEAGKTIDQLRAEVEHLKRHQFNASMAAAMLDLRDAVKGDQRAPSHVVVKEAIAEVERLRGELARAVTISEVDPYNWYGEEDRKSRWLSDFLEQQRALHSVVSDGNARTDDPRPIDGNYIRANLSNKAKQSQPEPAKGVEDLLMQVDPVNCRRLCLARTTWYMPDDVGHLFADSLSGAVNEHIRTAYARGRAERGDFPSAKDVERWCNERDAALMRERILQEEVDRLKNAERGDEG